MKITCVQAETYSMNYKCLAFLPLLHYKLEVDYRKDIRCNIWDLEN